MRTRCALLRTSPILFGLASPRSRERAPGLRCSSYACRKPTEIITLPRARAQIDAAFDKYYKADANLIRPSGNPLDMAGFKAMMASPDIIVESDVVASVDDVKEIAGGQAAVVVFTTLSKFSYKGTPNDDVAKFSVTYEKVDDTWKIVHLHRGTGQKPE